MPKRITAQPPAQVPKPTPDDEPEAVDRSKLCTVTCSDDGRTWTASFCEAPDGPMRDTILPVVEDTLGAVECMSDEHGTLDVQLAESLLVADVQVIVTADAPEKAALAFGIVAGALYEAGYALSIECYWPSMTEEQRTIALNRAMAQLQEPVPA